MAGVILLNPITGTVNLSEPITGTVGISGPVAVTQGTTPWVISGSISVSPPALQNVTGSDWTPTVTGSVGILIGGVPVSPLNPVPITGSISVTPPAVQNVTGSNWIPTVTGTIGLSGPITGTVGLSGPVAISNFPVTQVVSASNWIPTVTGTIGISGPITGTVGISGPIAVSNFPAVQIVSGSNWIQVVAQGPVASGSSPWNVTGSVVLSGPITGTVGLSGPVAVSNFPATQIVSGSNWIQVVSQGPVASGSFPWNITGSVNLSGPITGTVGISGPITGNVGITSPVSVTQGTIPWIISGSNWIPTVTGTVGLSGPITGTVGLSGPITGSVKITEAVQVVQASGTTPWSITGSVGLTGPITGTVGISAPVTVVQGTNPWIISGSNWIPTVTGTIGLSGPITGTVGISGPITGTVSISSPITDVVDALTGSGAPAKAALVGGSDVAGILRALKVFSDGTLYITGSVGLTSAITGTVSLSGPITGTVGLSGPITGSVALTAPITGNVGVTNFPAIQQITGSVFVSSAGSAAARSGFVFGKVDTSTAGEQIIEHTVYTEMTGNFKLSLSSASGTDTVAAGGTGARTVKVTYYSADGSGPYTETVQMSGTTAVPLSASVTCYIEKMELVTAGSYGTNKGTISLKIGATGAGGTVGSILGNHGRTYWAHHYIASGSTCYITTIYGSHFNNTSQGSGGTFFVRSKDLSVSDSANVQATDYLNAYGQASTSPRPYATPIVIPGPARLQMFVFPDAALTVTYVGSFDFYEQSN